MLYWFPPFQATNVNVAVLPVVRVMVPEQVDGSV